MNSKEILELHEGKKSKLYKCTAGKWSIGVGRNLEDKGLRPDEIELMFKNDIQEAVDELEKFFPWTKGLDPVRKYVLVDMSFNMGITVLRQFVNTLGMVQRGEYKKASEAMLQSKWASQVGNRARRLSKMMDTGQWPTE
jgi:lysozyme